MSRSQQSAALQACIFFRVSLLRVNFCLPMFNLRFCFRYKQISNTRTVAVEGGDLLVARLILPFWNLKHLMPLTTVILFFNL